ncbi:MAG: TolC family protein [Fibrobacter sp.]|nr:TolC family protein [Fibrobacter sp.]
MKKYCASLISVITVATPLFAKPITLQDALDMAKASNSQIKSERAKVEIAESEESEALSRFMPSLSLSASVTKINDPITIDLSSLQAPLSDIAGAAAYSKAYLSVYNQAYGQVYQSQYENAVNQMMGMGLPEEVAKSKAKETLDENAATIWSGVVSSKDVNDKAQLVADQYGQNASKEIEKSKDFKMKVQDDVFFNARLTAVWPLFTGFKRTAAYDAAKGNVTAKKAAFEMAQNTVLMDVATKYFTLRLSEELTALRETTKKNLEEHLERSKKLEAGGQISKAERLRAEVALAEAQNALEDSYRDQSLARMALASLLHTDTNLTAVTPVLAPEQTPTMEEFKSLAIERHPGLQQLRTERKRSQNAVKAAQGDYYPMVALFAYKELYTRDLTILEPEWAVGAKLQWDLFKGGETRSKVANAKALDRSLLNMEESTLDNIKLLVEKRWREKEHAMSRLTSLNKTRELAEEALRSQTLAYEAGLATGLEVVDAELSLARLQVGDLKAHYDAVIAWLGLLEASGEVVNAGAMLSAVQPVEEVRQDAAVTAPATTPVLLPATENAVATAALPADASAESAPAVETAPAEAAASAPAEPASVEAVPAAETSVESTTPASEN